MRQLLLDDLNYDPDDTAMPQDASSRNNSSNDTNRSNGNICEGVATASANDSSSAAQKEAEKKEAEEEEDDLSLCIVCMTEKRNACLVHGKTSHQVGGGGVTHLFECVRSSHQRRGRMQGIDLKFLPIFYQVCLDKVPLWDVVGLHPGVLQVEKGEFRRFYELRSPFSALYTCIPGVLQKNP